MATLKDVALMTNELDRLSGELHAELTEGEIDFEKMVRLSDSISENADRLAGAFSTMADALQATLTASDDQNGSSGDNASSRQ